MTGEGANIDQIMIRPCHRFNSLTFTNSDPSILRVPQDVGIINAAVNIARKNRTIQTIHVDKGTHILQKDSNDAFYVSIDFPITILGLGDKNEVVVVGGHPLLWKMSLWSSVVVRVWLRLALLALPDAPMWKFGNVWVEWLQTMVHASIDRSKYDGAW